MLPFTGERYVSHINIPEISYEHWHRYLWAEQFVQGKVVLDIASGEGYGSNLLADSAARVVGVDISEESVQFAASKYLQANLEFYVGSAAQIPIEGENIFDVIVCFETIEHLSEEHQQHFFSEASRLIKPDGLMLISTPNKLFYSDKTQYQNEHHLKEFYPHEFVALLKSHFGYVSLFGQKVYPASYLWSLESAGFNYQEVQLEQVNGHFAPTPTDRKEALYVVALCSFQPITTLTNSLLIDCDNQAIQQRIDQVNERDRRIHELDSIIVTRDSSISQLHDHLHMVIMEAEEARVQCIGYETELSRLRQEMSLLHLQAEHSAALALQQEYLHKEFEARLVMCAAEQERLNQQLFSRNQEIIHHEYLAAKVNRELNTVLNSPIMQIAQSVRLFTFKLRSAFRTYQRRK